MLLLKRALMRWRHRFGRYAVGDIIATGDGSLATVVNVKPLIFRVNRVRQASLRQEGHHEPAQHEVQRRAG